MKKYTILFIAIIFFAIQTKAQTVSNVKATQNGDKINVSYTLSGFEANQKLDIKLYCSTNGGSTWGNQLKALTGNAGEITLTNTSYNGTITWDVLEDVSTLNSTNTKFKVTATVLKTD